MGKIIIDQHIFCVSYESAKKISNSFEHFHFKFYDLGKNSSVYAKRYIRKTLENKFFTHKVIVRYSIEYDGEFLEYGFLDKRTRNRYPELVEKLSVANVYQKKDIIFEYKCKEDDFCRDIYYYEDFEEFFKDKLILCINKIYMACVIAFADTYRTDCFAVYYTEKGQNYERGYFAKNSYDGIRLNNCYTGFDKKPIALTMVWNWMQKYHKYKKDKLVSEARPLTALTYALNRSGLEKTFYSVVGLESVFTKSEKGVRKQLKYAITKVFPNVSESDIDLCYNKRSDFSHGDIIFPDYYVTSRKSYACIDLLNIAQKATLLLIMTLRELVKNDAIKIIVDQKGDIVFEKHQLPY